MDRPHHTTICYADCFSGISGNMFLGALIHAGFKRSVLHRELEKLHIDGYHIVVKEKTDQSISALKLTVNCTSSRKIRTLPTILNILNNSELDPQVIEEAAAVFQLLAAAEAKVHGIDINDVHFHEIGALDTIIDVVGTIVGLRQLGIDQLVCSSLPTGHGFIKCAHGLLPIPAPAVCELLRGIPTYGLNIRQELITPTGAALVAALADDFGPMPPITITATGYGAGSHILDNDQPNFLRLIIGKPIHITEQLQVDIIETNLDDCSPETFPHLYELLFERGALDVTLTPVHMKKGRPGFTLQVVCSAAAAHTLKETILAETTAIGLRFRKEQRWALARKKIRVNTPWGQIYAKKVRTPSKTVIYPEYEECHLIANRHRIPLQEVYNVVRNSRVEENNE